MLQAFLALSSGPFPHTHPQGHGRVFTTLSGVFAPSSPITTNAKRMCWSPAAAVVPDERAGLLPGQDQRVSACCLNTQAEGFPALNRPQRCCHLSPWEITVWINMNPPS